MSKFLPPSWDPGYAQPPNAKAEGIQRRAFVTKWAPRGTYDSSVNPTGGYAQPKYVMAEGAGQGTFTTDWVPSGSYAGPGIPHWMNQLPGLSQQYVKIKSGGPGAPSGAPLTAPQGMGDVRTASGRHPYAGYGQAAATQILSRVTKLPAPQRKPALQKILNSVDPTLYSKIDATARKGIAAGQPPLRALHSAIAQHFALGLGKEVVSLGKGHSPRTKSLLGLGMYGSSRSGRSGLGATTIAATLTGAAVAQAWANTTVNGVSVADGQCTSDGALVWWHGQWRIVTPSDPPCVSSVALTKAQVMAAGVQLYVGPFPWGGINQIPGEVQVGSYGVVQTYATPGAIGGTALKYIGQKITASWASASCPSNVAATMANIATKQLTTAFSPIQSPIDTYGLPDNCTYKNPPQFSSTASLGTVIGGVQVALGPDPQGFQCHIANGGSGVNYKSAIYYDESDWLAAMGIVSATNPSQTTTPWIPSRFCKAVGILDGVSMCNMQHDPIVSMFNAFQELNYGSGNEPADVDVPFFKFPDPITGDTWGVWLAFGLNSNDNATPGYPTSTGAPQSVHLEVGFAPIPGCDLCFLSDVLEFIFWLPAQIFIDATEVVGATLGALGAIACAVMTQPGAVSAGMAAGKVLGGGAGAAAGAAGAATAQAACGGPSVPPMPPPVDTSWILPVALLGLGAVVLLTRPKKKASTTPP